ncbi:hypothetical protein ACOMHN_009043 [Nucella lapillus]
MGNTEIQPDLVQIRQEGEAHFKPEQRSTELENQPKINESKEGEIEKEKKDGLCAKEGSGESRHDGGDLGQPTTSATTTDSAGALSIAHKHMWCKFATVYKAAEHIMNESELQLCLAPVFERQPDSHAQLYLQRRSSMEDHFSPHLLVLS